MGFSLKRGLTALGTGGLSEVYRGIGGKKGVFGEGPKDITPEDERAGISEGVAAQREALSELRKGTTLESLKPQLEIEKQAIRSSAEDTLRRLRDLRAARGQVNTSLGQGTESGIMKQSALQQAMIGASANDRLRQMQMQNIQAASPLAQRDRQVTTGSPGLAPLIGTVFGGVLGGPGGAMAGGAGGTALSSIFGGK